MADDPPEKVYTGFDDVAAGYVYNPDEGGLDVTATVTAQDLVPAEPAGLTDDGLRAALELLPTPLPTLSSSDLAKLAREMAMNIRPASLILQEFKLSDAHYAYLEKHHPFFKAAYRHACIEWHAPLNTKERISIEAAAILEDSLIGLGARMQNRAEGLPGVVEVAKLFAKVAGVGEREVGAGNPGERFTINIDLGGDTRITKETVAATPEAAPALESFSVSIPAPGKASGGD